MPVVGFLNGASPSGFGTQVTGFLQGLSESGYVEGHNVMIEYRWADGQYDRLPTLAADLVRRNVAVIFASGSDVGIRAAKAATTTIPIVFATATDPIESELVNSLSRPISNVTGVTLLFYRVEAKRLELFHELMPKAGTIGVLVNQSNPTTVVNERNLQAAADALGLRIDFLSASTEDEIEATFTTLARRRIGALFVMGDPYLNSRHDQLVALAARHAVPAIYNAREFAAAGGLISYGANFADVYRQAGIYVGKILKGAKPAELPVLQPTKFDLVINLKTAKTLGLEISPTLLARADEVIE
jgi:putative ABC transport system substrate-binding protein